MLLSAATAPNVDSTLGYLLTPQTIQKSECQTGKHCNMYLCKVPRILVASIRNLGKCPCPRCLIPLDRVHNLGMARDMSQRGTLARVDDDNRRSKVIAARRVIYEKHFQIDSAAVNAILQGESLVPNVVCILIPIVIFLIA